MKNSSRELIRIFISLSIAGFIALAFVLTTVFTNAFYDNLDNTMHNFEVKDIKYSKLEAQNRINKIFDFIKIYQETLKNIEMKRVKDNVNFAIDIIKDIYEQNRGKPKKVIYQKIHDRLANIRFFSDKSGYFFIYDLQGTCILLPTTPSLEGTNQINFLDGKKEHTIQRAIKIVKNQGEGFATWSWHKIGKKRMQTKIGFVKLFEPLNIFVGTARYQEDIDNIIKQEIKSYLKGLDRDEYGYIFAYDFSGNSMLEDYRYKNINRWNDTTGGYHLVRYAIKGAQVNPDGFFLKYSLKNKSNKFSYVKLIPDFNWIIGVNVKDSKLIYKQEKKSLKESIDIALNSAIHRIGIIIAVFIFIFFIIYLNMQKLFAKLEEKVYKRTSELIEQKNIFKKLFYNSSSGLALSKNEKIYDCNQAFLDIFEANEKEDILKLEDRDYFPDKQDDGQNSMDILNFHLDVLRKEDKCDFEIKAKTLKGREIWVNISGTKIALEGMVTLYFIVRDITARKRVETELESQQKKLMFQAQHDSLTSLPNRIFFMDRLRQGIKRLQRSKKSLAVVFLDIDNFKNINDAFGHDIGDLLLIEVASILRQLLRNTDTVARFGGDEFVILLDDLNSIDDSSSIIQKIIESFQEPFFIKNNPFDITMSIGISVYPNDAKDEMSLLKYADMAMYRAKNSGKNRYVYYDMSMNTDILEHIKLEQEIKTAIQRDEFVLHFQPQFAVDSGDIVGFEALVRWQHPQKGLLYPDYFIQTAENSNLIIPLGELISKKAMQQITLWHKMCLNPGIVSINFTSRQIESSNFFDRLQILLNETGCKPQWIEAELIERYLMEDTKKTIDMLGCFYGMGISVAIDDFGTGYSSLSYLKYLQISKLKIDKIFVDDLVTDKKDRAIAKSIIDLSRGLGVEVLAEGVETQEQYEILKNLGCESIQGYYFSKPLTSDDAEKLLNSTTQ